MQHIICRTPNEISVYVDLINSQAARNISQQPRLLQYAKEALLKQTNLKGPKVVIVHNLERTIGYNYVVETAETDSIFYAQVGKDPTFTRFIKNGKPLATQHVTIVLMRDEDGHYAMHDTWIGLQSPPRPGSPNATEKSLPYWENHAFVLDNQPLQLRTVTKVCPY